MPHSPLERGYNLNKLINQTRVPIKKEAFENLKNFIDDLIYFQMFYQQFLPDYALPLPKRSILTVPELKALDLKKLNARVKEIEKAGELSEAELTAEKKRLRPKFIKSQKEYEAIAQSKISSTDDRLTVAFPPAIQILNFLFYIYSLSISSELETIINIINENNRDLDLINGLQNEESLKSIFNCISRYKSKFSWSTNRKLDTSKLGGNTRGFDIEEFVELKKEKTSEEPYIFDDFKLDLSRIHVHHTGGAVGDFFQRVTGTRIVSQSVETLSTKASLVFTRLFEHYLIIGCKLLKVRMEKLSHNHGLRQTNEFKLQDYPLLNKIMGNIEITSKSVHTKYPSLQYLTPNIWEIEERNFDQIPWHEDQFI